MSEQHRSIEVAGRRLDWPQLLEEALTLPGQLGDSYTRFYPYSFLNQLLLRLQGVNEPVATYKRWQEVGRQVVKGSKAKAILRPMMKTVEEEDGTKHQRVIGFKPVNCIFGLSQTEGEELPEYEPPEWSKARALGKLAIEEVPFEHLDGNVAGYSYEHKVAVNPVAPYPFKTLIHEIAHVEAGHTAPSEHASYVTHRGVREFVAESTAYLVMNELDTGEKFDPAESRAYISSWLRGQRPPDVEVRNVFRITNTILHAGRISIAETEAL